ncbi:MAG: hypothetical protein MRERV_2c024 [Mycoplasmataceae bacterium RV_VA103A]|nr:MAG: hypothetical protein MRERV_2c024 [Mycoplasmataceae bacterium RV_VA103A]
MECSKKRFGSCSCCGKYHSWIQKNNESSQFCSEKCVNDYYPKTYEEGKIRSIGGLTGKVSAAVERGCDTIILPTTNSADYYTEVPLSVQIKVKKLHQVENWKDLWNFNLK